MTQTPPGSTEPSLPQAPPGTPSWLIGLFSLALLVAGPLLAFWNPSGHLNSGIAQALVIIAFVVSATVLFLVRELIDGLHRYGWSMTTLNFVYAASAKQLDQDWLEFKNVWPQVAPLLQALPGHQASLDSMEQTITKLEQALPSHQASLDSMQQSVTNLERSVLSIVAQSPNVPTAPAVAAVPSPAEDVASAPPPSPTA